MPESVQVLMSTYNGETYVEEQIESILTQDHPNVRLLIRDDGSSDATVSILKDYASLHANVEYMAEDNLGVVGSFFRLLECAEAADYYAFSDQDDVWRSDKLARAVDRLLREQRTDDEPLLYFNRQEFVDANLNHLGYSLEPSITGFRNALVQNPALGCTTVLNAAAHRLLVENPPDEALMHDWWAYAVVSAFGRVFYDPAPTLRYRQHGGNVVGDSESRVEHFRRRLVRFLTTNWRDDIFRPSDQAEELVRVFGSDLPGSARRRVRRMLRSKQSLAARILYALTADVRRTTAVDNLLFRFMVLINRY